MKVRFKASRRKDVPAAFVQHAAARPDSKLALTTFQPLVHLHLTVSQGRHQQTNPPLAQTLRGEISAAAHTPTSFTKHTATTGFLPKRHGVQRDKTTVRKSSQVPEKAVSSDVTEGGGSTAAALQLNNRNQKKQQFGSNS